MPTCNSSVEYSVNSRSSNVNIVYHDNETSQNGNGPQTTQKSTNKGQFPARFERASDKWWNLRMDSKVLEDQFKISSLPQVKSLFCQSVLFTSISSGLFGVYFGTSQASPSWIAGLVWALGLACISLIFLVVSNCSKFYQRYCTHLNTAFLLLLAVTGLISAYYVDDLLTVVGAFFVGYVVIILMYLILPFPVPIVFVLTVIFSIAFEVLLHVRIPSTRPLQASSLIAHVFLFVCLHIIGLQITFSLQIAQHSIFLKVCRLVKKTQAKDHEKEFKTFMITSVMPLSVGEKLLCKANVKQKSKEENNKPGEKKKEEPMFRPFMMERMENVSILYADIVGFTQMSSNKSADALVEILNALFGRFDRLCNKTGCEKISTLGDCYYCVAGCPESRPDHAICCVEMGLGMVTEIKKFCLEMDLNVNMRVGIHTGYVLCGVVGTRRFKFDVWSNDVSLANGMEQHGIPGRVHISKATLGCLEDKYIVEDSKLEERDAAFYEKTGKTFLIVRKKDEEVHSANKLNGDSINQVHNNLESKHATKEALISENVNAPEEKGENPAWSFDTRNQLSQYLAEHTSPFFNMLKVNVEDDRKFIKDVKDHTVLSQSYRNEQVNPYTSQFFDSSLERLYQNLCSREVKRDEPIQYSISPRYRFFWNIVLSTSVALLMFISSLLLLASDPSKPVWIIVFILLFALLVVSSIASGLYIFHTGTLVKSRHELVISLAEWKTRHVIGSSFLVIPLAIVLSHINQQTTTTPMCSNYMLLLLLALAHFLNFNQLSTFVRSILSLVIVVVALALSFASCPATSAAVVCQCSSNSVYTYEYILDFILLAIFVTFINRHFELAYRLDYYTDQQIPTVTEEIKTERMKVKQLMKNFIPEHVAKAMMEKRSGGKAYSKPHKKVGVVFATIVNFNELYEESFQGGKEFLRFLSELISDVDDLLIDEKYKDIEKIKTIGTTFMLASGLNPDVDQESTGRDSHLCRLMDFCIDMQNEVDRFNKDMLNFHLVLRIGFNYGEVTAGVIGSTKKLYDIWGDTVNIASRMDSTGVPNRVQVSEECMKALENHFNFSYLGEKFVKGKGMMKTYLLVRDDEEIRKIIPNPTQNYQLF